MQLDHLREFIAIADLRSFSKAAEKLFATQSALTRHIAAMEDEMGVRLLDRSTHGVALTPMGRRAYKTFSAILARYDELLGDVAGYLDGLTGKLCVGVLYYEMARYAMPVLDAFGRAYPNIEVQVESGQPRDMARLMREGVVDAALQAVSPSFDMGADTGFLAVAEFGYVALVPQEHRLACRRAVTLEDLEDEKLVTFGDDAWLSCQLEASLAACSFMPKALVDARNIDAVPMTVARHGAVALVAENLRGTYPGVAAVDVADERLRARLGYVYRRSNDNPALAAFLHTVTEMFEPVGK